MLTVSSFVFSPLQENTYIVYNEEKVGCVIDPGCYLQNEKLKLQNFISGHALQTKLLLNTHCHLDHVFGNKFVFEKFGTVPHIHPNEEQLLKVASQYGEMWGMPFENYEGELIFLKEGDIISIGGDQLDVIFTPGHAPGHICFYCRKQNFIISGDTLFRMSIGRTDLPLGDHDTLISSIRNKLFVLPDDTIVYPGHGQPTTIGFEKKNNPFMQ